MWAQNSLADQEGEGKEAGEGALAASPFVAAQPCRLLQEHLTFTAAKRPPALCQGTGAHLLLPLSAHIETDFPLELLSRSPPGSLFW